MKEIRTEDAVGHILCHDITQIIKDEKKGVLFKKGHVVKEEDIPLLLSVGKEHLFVWEKKTGILHENEAAEILYKICAGNSSKVHGTEIKEGKIEVVSKIDGVLKIRREALVAVNSLGEMMIASRHGDFPVKKGDKIAGTRIIPLVIEKEKMDAAEKAAGSLPIFDILPYRQKKVGIITTGSEIKKGLIRDTFTPVLREKLSEFPTEVTGQVMPGDDKEEITKAILSFADAGVDLIICTGGMSVDLLVAYLERNGRSIPVLGLPGCVMYAKRTVFDLILPRVMADDEIKAEEIAGMGEGGLCLNCPVCTFPNCGFGK